MCIHSHTSHKRGVSSALNLKKHAKVIVPLIWFKQVEVNRWIHMCSVTDSESRTKGAQRNWNFTAHNPYGRQLPSPSPRSQSLASWARIGAISLWCHDPTWGHCTVYWPWFQINLTNHRVSGEPHWAKRIFKVAPRAIVQTLEWNALSWGLEAMKFNVTHAKLVNGCLSFHTIHIVINAYLIPENCAAIWSCFFV